MICLKSRNHKMKKIDKALVFIAVKYQHFFFWLSFISFFTAFFSEKIYKEKIDVYIFFSIIVTLACVAYYNSRDDEYYILNNEYAEHLKYNPDDLFEIRGQSVWICIFVGTLLYHVLP